MIICKTLEEFIDYYIWENKSFEELTFENERQYKRLYKYCKRNRKDPYYLLILGKQYYYGKGIKQNYRKSFICYTKAVKLNSVRALKILADSYKLGMGCERNWNLARELYFRAADLGDTDAMLSIVILLPYFTSVCDAIIFDYNKLFSWNLIVAKKYESVKAMLFLGNCYELGEGCVQDFNQAFIWYQKAADKGDDSAMLYLGTCYEYGDGCDKDILEAFKWYIKAAHLGNYRALSKIILLYKTNDTINKQVINIDEIYELLYEKREQKNGQENKCLCDTISTLKEVLFYEDPNSFWEYSSCFFQNNSRHALYEIGKCYENGLGSYVEQNLLKAFNYYYKSAKLNYVQSVCKVALFYEEGKLYPRNYEKAFNWYITLNELDHANLIDVINDNSIGIGKFRLGVMYENGLTGIKNEKKALECFEEAIYNGFPLAVDKLINFYKNGLGCKVNFNKVVEYYEFAIKYRLGNYQEEYEAFKREMQNLEMKKNSLSFGERKDVFISWNHLDKDIKDDMCDNLEKKNLLTVWQSDGNGVGEINEVIKEAIISSRSYIILLTGNSIKSKWVEKEVKIILSKVKENKEYENTIRPVIIDRIINQATNEVEKFDVIKSINEFDNNNSFKELLNYCSSFENFEIGFNYDNISSFLYEAIGNNLKIEYKKEAFKKFERFSSALNSVVLSRKTKTGIIPAMLEFESGYLNRKIYDKNNNAYDNEFLLTYSTPSLIYGEGGSGKTLYLKNFMRKYLRKNEYVFYIECKSIENESNDFLINLKKHSFDIYFEHDESEQLSIHSFKQIFNTEYCPIILIDALDEISQEKRRKLLEQINIFYTKYRSKLIFTSRNDTDLHMINSIFDKEINCYQLRGINKTDIEKMYQNLSVHYEIEDQKKKKKLEDKFFEKLQDISEDIKKNPLLISNLIFIYFATHKIPDTSFDIINESVLILINDLEEERLLKFEYQEYLTNKNLNKLLGYLALQRSYNNTNPAEVIIKEYLEENYENIDYSKIADEIYKYLRRRAIIVNENISHEIFKNYFASSYIFLEMYKKKSNIAKKKYFELTEEGREFLKSLCSDEFQKDDETWNNIAIDLLYKLDFEIFNLDPKKIIDNNHLSYNAFDTTLIKTLTEKGYNETTISIIKNLLDRISFHYNEFIKQYIK